MYFHPFAVEPGAVIANREERSGKQSLSIIQVIYLLIIEIASSACRPPRNDVLRSEFTWM